MKKHLLILILFPGFIFSQSAGNTGLSFLKFGFGARNIAMGDAGNSASSDLSALYYNPARLTQVEKNEVFFMHNSWIQDVNSEQFGIKWDLFGLPWAIGLNYTSVNDIPVRTRPGEAETTFDATYFFGSLSTGFIVWDKLSVGATIKYLYEGMLNDEATGLGYDFGISYETAITGLSFSSSIRNLGSMNSLRVEETKLPVDFRIGSAYTIGFPSATLEVVAVGELQKYLDTDDIHFNLGGDVVYDHTVAVRIGYQSGYEAKGITAGFGLMWGNLAFDYAYLPFSLNLGNANLFSLRFKF
jgi:hypothetical protein